jgi:hypothetical protein
VLFHQDNAPVHTSLIAMSKIQQLKFELLRHPPYSPDLAPCDFHLFPNLKKWLGGKRFANDNEVIDAVNDYFADLDKSTYQSGITALEHRWNKCIELNGDYVEKYQKSTQNNCVFLFRPGIIHPALVSATIFLGKNRRQLQENQREEEKEVNNGNERKDRSLRGNGKPDGNRNHKHPGKLGREGEKTEPFHVGNGESEKKSKPDTGEGKRRREKPEEKGGREESSGKNRNRDAGKGRGDQQQDADHQEGHGGDKQSPHRDSKSYQKGDGWKDLLHEGGSKEDPDGVRRNQERHLGASFRSHRDAMQEETRQAEARATKAETETKKLRERIRQLTEEKEAQTRPRQKKTEGEKDLRGPSQKKLDQLHEEAVREETQKRATEATRSTPTPAPRKKKQKKQEGEWTTVSYAQKLKEKFPARHETLVKFEGQDEAGAKRTLSGLNIHEIGGPLAQVVSRKDGSLLLVSQGEEQKKRLEETLKKKQGVKVTQVEKLNPTITLTGLGREWKPEEVVVDIWEKNEGIRMERTKEQFTAEVRVLSKRVCKDPNKQNVGLTMDAKTQEECLKRKKAVVGLTFFWMEEKFEVNRCFNCHGYGHQKKDCKQELTCYKCGGAHIKKDCKAEKKNCPNCVREGRKEVNHQATDRWCPVYQRRLEIKVGRTARN